ncbi:MAG: hypothetical protein R3B06_08420 [Kofleriaceae bacterium]
MRRIATAGLVPLFALAAACGGDDGGSIDAGTDIDAMVLENPGFPTPTMVTKANMNTGGVWTEVGDADWSCLNTPSADQPSTQAIALSGKIRDFQDSANGVRAATVTAFPGIMLSGSSGTATSGDTAQTAGDYSMSLAMLPGGTTRFGFKVEATGYLKTYLLNQYFNPANATQTRNIDAISEGTANALPALVGISRDPAKGVLAGALRDCAGHEVSNAVATVSSTQGAVAHLTGAKTFYFSATNGLPVRNSQAPVMSANGLFVVLELPPQTAPAFIQVWGFRTAADLAAGTLTLLSELPSPVEANAVITGSFEPVRQ